MLAGVIMVAAAAASWGTWSLFLRPTHLPGMVTAPIVFLVMGLVALPFGWFEARARWDRTAVLLLFGNAACDALNVVAFFAAIDHTTVAIAVLTHYLAPVLIALAAPRIDKVTTRGAGLAAAIALAGLVIVLEPSHAPADGAVVGALLGAASAVGYAANTFVVRRLAARIGTARAVGYHSLIAGVALLPIAFATGGFDAVTAGDLGWLVTGGATLGTLSGIVYVSGLTRIGSARTAVLTYIEPLVAVAIGVVVWGEPFHASAIVGGALVVAAGIHVARSTR